MALIDLLNLASVVSVIRAVSTPDGMGGETSTSVTTYIPLCALWQNGQNNKWAAGKYALTSTHTLCFDPSSYTFDTSASTDTVVETINYKNETYKRVGFPNNYLEYDEILTQGLERIS
jgi:hypothetical protein